MEERLEGQKQHLLVVTLQPTGQVILVKGRRKGKNRMVVAAGAQQNKQQSTVSCNSVITWQEREGNYIPQKRVQKPKVINEQLFT